MLRGDSPRNTRNATFAVLRLKSSMDRSGPPTMPSPSWVLCKPNMGALATACSSRNVRSSICGTPFASSARTPKKIAEWAGSVAHR